MPALPPQNKPPAQEEAPAAEGGDLAAAPAPAPSPASEPAAAVPAPAPTPSGVPSQPNDPGGRYSIQIRVGYSDTDRLGIVYYANYLKFFEQARTEFLRSLGISYADLETQRRLYLPVVESRVEYLGPSGYDAVLDVQVWLSWLGPASLIFQNEIHQEGKIVARGFTRHAVLNEMWKPTRVPKDFKELLTPYLRSD